MRSLSRSRNALVLVAILFALWGQAPSPVTSVHVNARLAPTLTAGVQPNPTLAQMSIPAPPFGLTETVTTEYGTDTFSTYWVDSATGNDGTAGNGGNGTQVLPRLTLPTMTALVAGDVVQACGTFSRGTSDLVITATGNSSSPVFFRGATGCTLTITFTGAGNVNLDTSTYLIFEHVIVSESDGLTAQSANHVSIRDNDISGTGLAADSGEMTGLAGSSYMVRARNTVHDGGDWSYAAAENDTHCLGISSSMDHIWDLWNTVYHCSGDGVGNGHDANHTTHDLYIGGNLLYLERENCIDLKEVHTVLISRNECHDIVGTVASAASREAIVIHQGPTTSQGAYDVWIINNLIYTVGLGVAEGGSDTSVSGHVLAAIGNVIYDCSAGGQSGISNNTSSSATLKRYYFHNTIVDCPIGIIIGSGMLSAEQGGNIVSNATSRHYQNDTSGTTSVTTVNNELFYQGGSNVAIAWGGASVTDTTVAAWISRTGKGTGSLQSDPLFTSSGSHDYSLTAGSPAINAGADMSSYETAFQAVFGTSLLIDIAGTARPNGVWDMGAYER